MSLPDIDKMRAEKGQPCISITIPTFKYTRGRMKNPELVENALLKTRALLTRSAWPKKTVIDLQEKLNSLLKRIDYMRLQEGLAIFISPNFFRMHLLPFAVKEKVVLANTFEIRDMVYLNQFLRPYYLLAMSKKRVRLFKGSGRDLQEIVNDDFPKPYKEQYEYARPGIASGSSSGLKAFERDKSIVVEDRLKTFLREADTTLHKYIKPETKLFIAGVREELADFEHISHHAKNIAAKIPGNYDVDAVHPLAEIAWQNIQASVINSHKTLVQKLQESIGTTDMAVDGISSVWKAAKEGKGLTLLLEKDYQQRAYLNPENDSHLFLSPPIDKHLIIQDAADDVIEIVLEKGGSVVMVENGDLKEFHRVALLLRYS